MPSAQALTGYAPVNDLNMGGGIALQLAMIPPFLDAPTPEIG